jgi:hypothetical protein
VESGEEAAVRRRSLGYMAAATVADARQRPHERILHDPSPLPAFGVFQKSGFKLLLEILVRARIQSVAEVPFAFGLRFRGASKANFRVAWDYGLLLVRLYAGKIGLGPRS